LSRELVLLCTAADVAPGSARKVGAGKAALAVFNLDGEFYATDDRCTHGFASLSAGVIAGDQVTCPWHGGAFDIRTGAPVNPPCTVPLRTYPVVLREGELWADLGSNPNFAGIYGNGSDADGKS
jgi:nitrite reductase/ring-hydroxylating ferredoxin subunit